ncbi:MAG: hypothetical protein KIS92_14335 [Planctomycetota bacterium]|nr:hypothetical protein [Planctomycetota bacterium]
MSSKPGLTQTLYALTTRVFRCRGLSLQSPEQDKFGGHDAAYWIVFCALAAGWFFFLFEPQRQRNEMLRGRQDVLQSQLRAESVELRRLRNEINLLQSKDPTAWERAARQKLGWLKPGEVTDVLAWRRASIAAGKGDPAPPPRIVRPGPAVPRRAPNAPAPQAVTQRNAPAPSNPPRTYAPNAYDPRRQPVAASHQLR